MRECQFGTAFLLISGINPSANFSQAYLLTALSILTLLLSIHYFHYSSEFDWQLPSLHA